MGRIISVHEYDLKPGINIGQSNAFPGHRSTRPAAATWKGHHARTSYFIVVTCVLRSGLVTGGFSAAAPDPQNRLDERLDIGVGQRRVVIRGEKSMVDRAVQSIQPELLPSGLHARQR